MTETTFKIRSYGKSELALLYFPDSETAAGALSNLNSWLLKPLRRPLSPFFHHHQPTKKSRNHMKTILKNWKQTVRLPTPGHQPRSTPCSTSSGA